MKRFIIFLITFLCLFNQAYPYDDLKFHTLSHKGGLSYDGIIDIKQDGKGFMWIMLGTNLFRFDGYTYKSYKDNFNNTPDTLAGYFNNLATDLDGNLYASISNGVYKYDFLTDSFAKIIDSPVQVIHIDRQNRFWTSSRDEFSFKEGENRSITPEFTGNKQSLNKKNICEDGDHLYFFSFYGKIFKFDPSTTSINLWINIEQDFDSGRLVDAIIKNGQLWILTNKFSILRVDLETGKVTYKYTHPQSSEFTIKCLYVTDEEIPWIGTMNGLYVIDPETNESYYYQNNKNDKFSLPNNSVWTINEDNQKNIWIGTYTGAFAYVNRHEKKVFETHNLSHDGLNKVPVSAFNQENGRIWISTEGGGVNIFDKDNQHFTYLRHEQDQQGLSSDNTKSSVVDQEGNIWVATYMGGLNHYDRKTKRTTHYRRQSGNTNALRSNNLRKIVLEPDSGLWVFYLEHTPNFSFFSFKEKRFRHDKIDDTENSMYYDYIYDASRDDRGRLWMITSFWLYSMDVKSKEKKMYPIPSQQNPASTLCIDDHGILWIGTFGNELIRFNPVDESFQSFPDIFQSDIAEIYSINQSTTRNGDQIIWMGTNDGLYMYHVATQFLTVFRESDGTQGDVYYPLSTMKDSDGLLYFGGTGGFTIVNPEKVSFNPLRPTAIITDFYVDNQSVMGNDNNRETVKLSNDMSSIQLKHKQQNIGFNFSSNNYLNADKNLFRYRLKNYDNRWIQTDASNRTIFYSKIPAGRYEFQLQAANNDGLWGDISSVQIIRKQTPWLSTPAIFVYLLLLGSLLYFFISTYRTRKKLELQLYLDQVEKEKNEEIHKNQLQFFTNISHDLKTPLSLIMITINKMREEGMREYYYRILNNNSERLLRMLNDILDFRKIQYNSVQLQVSNGNLSEFIQNISGDFQEYARQKEINYQIITDDETISNVPFDKRVMEKIIMNLLINSFKYTRKGDSISIMAGINDFKSKYAYSYTVGYDDREGHEGYNENSTPDGNNGSGVNHEKGDNNSTIADDSLHANDDLAEQDTFSIIVSDTGVGITKESIAKVFDRFYQVNSKNQLNHLGTGIGLALVKNLVLLHKGRITIYSERYVGSDFVIELPASTAYYLPDEIQSEEEQAMEGNHFETDTNISHSYPGVTDQVYPAVNYQAKLINGLHAEYELKEKTIILAEDNVDLRNLIKESLSEKYEVIDFGDGKPALEYLNENDADMIISDIMMPEMDGITFCKNIKANIETSHIPFIMLTAKSGVESLLEGTESGADLYFEKPVELTVLKTSMLNIFKQQEALKEHYAKNYYAETANVSLNKQDNLFLKEITEIIEEHLDQSTFDVNTIASKMMMSRSKLYSKLKTLTGKSVVEFILSYRLRRAAKLLIESDMNIQQAMYAVGIESRSYFTKAFKKEFNMTPSQFVQKNKKKPSSNPDSNPEEE